MPKVFIVGSLNHDLVAEAERHPAPGETVRGSSFSQFAGGKGLNQAVASARAGMSTVMVGCVGDDAAGDLLNAFLADSGVDTSGVVRDEHVPTGTAIVTVCQGENTIVVIPGANGELTPDRLTTSAFRVGDVVAAQFETPIDTTREAFVRAKGVGATTVLNPAPAAAVPQHLLDVTDVLVLNEHEFATVFGVAVREIVDAEERPAPVAARYAGTLVVTLGAAGVVAWLPGGRFRALGELVETVDSTGAGDCFVGYLAAGIAANEPLDVVIRRANRAAALSVTRPGAAASIPTVEALTV